MRARGAYVYEPPFRTVDRLKEALRAAGGSLTYEQLAARVGRRLDCPLVLMALMADPSVRVHRKACTVRLFAPVAPPATPADEDAWAQGVRRGMPARSLCQRGRAAMERRRRAGLAVSVEDWGERERVWFPLAPRLTAVPPAVAELLLGLPRGGKPPDPPP